MRQSPLIATRRSAQTRTPSLLGPLSAGVRFSVLVATLLALRAVDLHGGLNAQELKSEQKVEQKEKPKDIKNPQAVLESYKAH